MALALLIACSEEDVILPGERFNLRDVPVTVNRSLPLQLTAARSNADWTHRNGNAQHLMDHPALPGSLSPAFVAPIGEGDSRRARITSEPVIAGGVVYTLDARATVTATSTSGQTIWSRNLTPGRHNPTDASGGGITVSGGQVYVTTGFGEVSAVDAGTGQVRWVQDLDAPAIAAPTVRGDLVYVVARDSSGWALDTTTGRVRWQLRATPSTANYTSGAAPAVNSNIAVFPFPSGEVIATFPEGGLRRWSAAVTGDRLGRASAIVTDIGGDPVIDGTRVYVGNFGGRVVALDIASGDRIWTATEGAAGPLWPAGDALFLINDLNQLVRLEASSGQPVWRIDMPVFLGEDTKRERRVVAHYGPILAGGRLIVASTDGVIRQFDPQSGAQLASIEIAGGAASAPVVAAQTLYVVSKSGQLHAFR